METLTEEQKNASKAVCRFEEDNKNLSLNEKIELIRERKDDKLENAKNYGWSEEDAYLHWYYTNLRESKVEEGIRNILEGLTYEEATMALKYLGDDLRRESLKHKL